MAKVVDNVAKIKYVEQGVQITNVSNTVTTNLIGGNLTVVKIVDRQSAQIGEILNYTINITNTGCYAQANVTVVDELYSKGLEYIEGSLKINGACKSGDLNRGIVLPYVQSGTTVIEFQARILPKC